MYLGIEEEYFYSSLSCVPGTVEVESGLGMVKNEGIVPGTERRFCTRYKNIDGCQAQYHGSVPGTKLLNCAWHPKVQSQKKAAPQAASNQ